ncbi:MAG: hypothetical protein AAFY08_00935 [Planctomycetota bacterium]
MRRLRRGHRWRLILCAAALGVGGVACNSNEITGPAIGRAAATDAWRPVPVSLRIHPATQYRLLDGEPVLEVRVELFDDMGDPIKASGSYQFELTRDGVGLDDAEAMFYRWDEIVRSESDQLERYDAVTRSYVFPLTLDSFAPAEHATRLRARADLPGGRTLEASAPLISRDRR